MSSSPRFRLPIGFVFAVCVLASPSADEGMWTFDNPPLKAAEGEIRLHADARVARSRAALGRALQRRRLGLVRQRRRTGADEPPRGARPAAEALDGRARTTCATASCADVRREELKCPDLELNVLVSIEDVTRASSAAVEARHGRRSRRWRPARPSSHSSRRRARGHRPAVRCRDALPRRRVLALSLQEIHRRPPRLRAGAAGRVLRRRSGQLQVSRATTSTWRCSASTRTAAR